MRRLLAVFLLSCSVQASDVVTKIETVKVAEGIVAYIAAEPRSGVVNSNCVAIIGDDGVLVVDTGQMPSLAKRMIADIKTRTDKPVRYVVNTHWHWDHNLANFVYRDAYPNAAIVSSAFTRQGLVDWTPPFLAFMNGSGETLIEGTRKRLETAANETEKANLADDLDDFVAGIPEVKASTFVAPNETFTDSMTVYLGKRRCGSFIPAARTPRATSPSTCRMRRC